MISASTVRNLGQKEYEKRKHAALEVAIADAREAAGVADAIVRIAMPRARLWGRATHRRRLAVVVVDPRTRAMSDAWTTKLAATRRLLDELRVDVASVSPPPPRPDLCRLRLRFSARLRWAQNRHVRRCRRTPRHIKSALARPNPHWHTVHVPGWPVPSGFISRKASKYASSTHRANI